MRSCLGEREGEGSPCEWLHHTQEAMHCVLSKVSILLLSAHQLLTNSCFSVSVLLQVDIERDVLATLSQTRQCAEDLLATQHSPPEEAVKAYSAELVQVCGVVCGCVWVYVGVGVCACTCNLCNVSAGGQQYIGLVYCSLCVYNS